MNLKNFYKKAWVIIITIAYFVENTMLLLSTGEFIFLLSILLMALVGIILIWGNSKHGHL